MLAHINRGYYYNKKDGQKVEEGYDKIEYDNLGVSKYCASSHDTLIFADSIKSDSGDCSSKSEQGGGAIMKSIVSSHIKKTKKKKISFSLHPTLKKRLFRI